MTEFQNDQSNPDIYMSPNSNLGLIENSLLGFSWKWLVSAFVYIYLHAPPTSRFFTCLLWNLCEWTPLSSCFWGFYMYSNPKCVVGKIFYHSNILFALFFCLFSFWFLNKFAKVELFFNMALQNHLNILNNKSTNGKLEYMVCILSI